MDRAIRRVLLSKIKKPARYNSERTFFMDSRCVARRAQHLISAAALRYKASSSPRTDA